MIIVINVLSVLSYFVFVNLCLNSVWNVVCADFTLDLLDAVTLSLLSIDCLALF